jgi:hypothetical protein
MRNAHLFAFALSSTLVLAPAALAYDANQPITGDVQISVIPKNLGPSQRQLNKDSRAFYWKFRSSEAAGQCEVSFHTREITDAFGAAYPYRHSPGTKATLNEYGNEDTSTRYQRDVTFWMHTPEGDVVTVDCQRYGRTPPPPFTLNEVRNIIGRNRAQILITEGELASRETATGESAVASSAESPRGRRADSAHGDARDDRDARTPQAAI